MRQMVLVCLWTWMLLGLGLCPTEGTDRPIVGILAQETFKGDASYIPAAYVKAVEASGARVVPLFINQPLDYYKRVMSMINGVVFPGGGVNYTAPHGFGAAGKTIVKIAHELQARGVQFPLLGVCQGFELLMFLAANSSYDVLVHCHGENLALPLTFLPGFNDSRLYSFASEEIIHILQTLPVTSNHHHFCVTRSVLQQLGLDKTWHVLSTSTDADGLEFVSSAEHFQRPIVGVQFHPEKSLFEWNPKQANPHSWKAVLAARHFYDWLVRTARLNNQSFPSVQEETDHLIYNYNPVYTGKHGGYDEQTYTFSLS